MNVLVPENATDDIADDITYDIVIVGGGIVGLVLACGLLSSDLQIAIIEEKAPQQVAERPRAYALSPRSAHIFRALGVWEQIAPVVFASTIRINSPATSV
ncbi:FAD-dependent monooxygenase [Parathermosynechococcus lividus]